MPICSAARCGRSFASARCVSTIHSISDGGRLRMAGYRLTNRLVDRVTIISRLAAERYVGDRRRPGLAPRGDSEHRRSPSGSGLVPEARAAVRKELGIGGRVRLAGGRSLPAGQGLSDDGRRVRADVAGDSTSRLILVGQGPLRGEVEALLRAAGLEDRVRFLGVRRDVPELMSGGRRVPPLLGVGRDAGCAARGGGGRASRGRDEGRRRCRGGGGWRDGIAGAAGRSRRRWRRRWRRSRHSRRNSGWRWAPAGRALVEERYSTASVMERWERLYSGLLRPRGTAPAGSGRPGAGSA